MYEAVLEQRREVTTPGGMERRIIDAGFASAVMALRETQRQVRSDVALVAETLVASFQSGGQLLLCGNGGSAADAQHFAAELVGRFKRRERRALPAMALGSDIATLSAWSNDIGYEDVFARQVAAYGRHGDVLIGISTSGRSRNVVRAFEEARRRGMHCVALVGGDGGALRPLAHQVLLAASTDTQAIQAAHIVLIHLLCELVEEKLPQAVAKTVAGDDGVHAPLAHGRLSHQINVPGYIGRGGTE